MEQRSVIGAEILVHHSLIDNDLLSLLAIGPVVVELEGLDELVLAVGIPFICLDNWHATLVRLNDVHREILYIVLIVFSYQITLHSNDFLFIRVLKLQILFCHSFKLTLNFCNFLIFIGDLRSKIGNLILLRL